MAIKGTIEQGDHVITTDLEHNSISRPLVAMERAGFITLTRVKHDGTGLKMHTFDNGVNWHPFPAPDGRHYVFTKFLMDEKDWEVFIGDLQGDPPLRLTYHKGFDGLASMSYDGNKVVFGRGVPGTPGTRLYVMDISSLGLSKVNKWPFMAKP